MIALLLDVVLRLDPPQVETGEPQRWILEVEHEAGAAVRLPEDPVAGDAWVLLEPRRISRSETATRATWTMLPLEPGERPLPALAVQVEANGVSRTLEVAASTTTVRPALAPGEDAPRPIRGFHPAPPRAGVGLVAILGGVLALFAAIAAAWIVNRRRRRPVVVVPPTALQRLAALASGIPEDEEGARRTVYALTRLLRESTDRLLAEPRPALDDLDWAALREGDARLPADARASIARILRDAEPAKYARHAPTRFALEALFADSGKALGALAEAA